VISPDVRQYLDQPQLAVVATINEDGSPLQSVVWYMVDGEAIVFNSRVGRRWPGNLARDPRVAVLFVDPTRYVEFTGRVEIDDDPEHGLAVISALARRYTTDPERLARQLEDFRGQTRVTFRLRPERILQHFE